MLKLPSWLIRNVWRAAGAGTFGRLIAAACGIFLIADSAAQTIQLTASAYSVDEDNGRIVVAARRFGNTNLTSTVRFTAVGDPNPATGAIDGQDFVARSSTVTFPTNATEAFFEIILIDNDRTNVNKFINLSLSDATGGTLGFPRNATIEIVDDESGVAGFATGTFEFSAAVYTVTDYESTVRAANGGSYPGANITVVRRGGNRGRVMVDVATGGGTAFP